MFRLLLVLFACISLLSCAAQRTGAGGVKIFAYRQPVLQGAAPTVILDDKGNRSEMVVKERANYFIYVESPSSNIKVIDLWVRKDHYTAGTSEVTTPVFMLTTMMVGATADTLVKRTSNKVLQVDLKPEDKPVKPSRSVQKKINANELVLHCVVNGTDYYYTVRAIKKLPPVALQ